jgi:hypothetical protein
MSMVQRNLMGESVGSGGVRRALTASYPRRLRTRRGIHPLIAALVVLLPTLASGTPPKPPDQVCVEGASNCGNDTVVPSEGRIKWHPGHYMLVFPDAPQSHLDDLRNEPNVQGVQVRYRWVNLERQKGVYDFSRIESDLRYLSSMPTPKRLILQILDRKFDTNDPRGIVPEYLLTDPEYNGGVARTKNGYTARLWNKNVMDRLIALNKALAKRFDEEPYFEGITSAETTPGFGSQSWPEDYSRAALAAQLKRMMAAARGSWQKTNVFIYTNYLVDELPGLIAYAHETGCGVGGPDVTPKAPSAGARIIMGIDGGRSYIGKTPVAFAIQSGELCGKEGCNRPSDLYKFAVNDLGVNYLFWLRFGTAKDTAADKYSWRDGMLPVIRANGGRINAACPANYRGACATD